MTETTEIRADQHQVVSATIGTEQFGIEVLNVREIIRYGAVTRVPEAPDFVEGVIDLRGSVVPVVDLRRRFGLEPKARDGQTRVLVVELEDSVVGFVVDAVDEVIRLDGGAAEPPPELARSAHAVYLTGVARLEDRLLLLLDLQKVLSEREEAALAEAT